MHCFFFSYGCVVLWGISENLELALVSILKQHYAQGALLKNEVRSAHPHAAATPPSPRRQHDPTPPRRPGAAPAPPPPLDPTPPYPPPFLLLLPPSLPSQVDDFGYVHALGAERMTLHKDLLKLSTGDVGEKLAASFALAQVISPDLPPFTPTPRPHPTLTPD